MKKPLPIAATVLMLLGIAVFVVTYIIIELGTSAGKPTLEEEVGDAIYLAAAALGTGALLAGSGLLSIISIIKKQWRAWSLLLILLCVGWFIFLAWAWWSTVYGE